MDVALALYPLVVLAVAAIWVVQLAMTLGRPPGRIDIVGALSWRTGWAILVVGLILTWACGALFVEWFSD